MDSETPPLERLLESADLAVALEDDQFKQFLDHIPVAIAVSKFGTVERIVYVNEEFERVIGLSAANLIHRSWASLPGVALGGGAFETLSVAVAEAGDYVGAFAIEATPEPVTVDAWSNLIEDDAGKPMFRLVALVQTHGGDLSDRAMMEARVQEKDIQLRELQHRVKNNLQMITALIRVEARGLSGDDTGDRFDRLAGRVEALGLLYRSLTETVGDEVDLGVYLSEIASAVMRAHAVEGIHLDMQVDTWPVSIDVAMPAGLVVNELLTNALKHAFVGRSDGTIALKCLADTGGGCRVVVADDGVGLPPGAQWPRPGKLSALIVRSLAQNANAQIEVRSAPGDGVQVSIAFRCADRSPSLIGQP